MDDVATALQAFGVAEGAIHREAFGPSGQPTGDRPAPHAPTGAPGSGPRVSFLRSGVTVGWDDRFASLLELAEACDIPVRWSCRTGVCHSCESGLIVGEVAYAPDPIDPPPPGSVLVCCARPTGGIELDL
jgi:ferredoxin